MSKVRVNVYLNGPTPDAPGNVHGTLKKFVCADLATEMPPEALTFREISYAEGYPRWSINGKDIDMFSIAIDPQYVGDYVLTAGCEPIVDVGIESQQIVENQEYNIVSKQNAAFTIAAQGTRPDDWYVRGDTKYYIKETKTYNGITYNYWNPVGFTNPNNQYAPATFDPNETYYTTDRPTAMDVYFASNAHFGMVMQMGLEQNYGNYIETRRLFGPSGYNWRPSYPYLSGAMPGLWKSDWEGGHIPGAYTWDYTITTASVIANTYDYRWKVYMFAHQMNNETYIGFLYTIENGLGIVQAANALIMSPDVAAGVIKTPDGGEISGIEGGDGTFDDSSDSDDWDDDDAEAVEISWNNVQDVFSPGYRKYLFTPSASDTLAWQCLCSSLWTPGFAESLRNKYIDPISAIQSCRLMPSLLAPDFNGSSDVIKIAGFDILTYEHGSLPVGMFTDNIKHLNLGTIDIGKYYDAFADFTNCSIYIHLPYIGMKPIDLSQCMGGSLTVDYYADAMTGDVVAWINVMDKDGNDKNFYEFKGNCSTPQPLTQRGNVWMGAAGLVLPIAGFAMGTAAGIAASYMAGAGEVISGSKGFYYQQGMSAAVQDANFIQAQGVQTAAMGAKIGNVFAAQNAGKASLNSNGAGGTVSTPTNGQCYLVIERPVWNNPQNYGELFGYPSDIGGTINAASDFTGAFEGFLSVRAIQLNSISATTEEKSEIEQLMFNGVYV